MKTGSKICIAIGGLLMVAVICCGFIAANYRPEYYQYYNLTVNNQPALYNVVDNKIDVMICDMNEEEYKNTLWAINEFDKVLENISVNIIEEPTNDHYVKIESVKSFENKNLVGLCQHTEPVRVSILHSFANRYWANSKLSVFGKIVLHELGHVLGLRDLKDEKYRGVSIMYHTYAGAQVYTDFDLINIQRYY